MMDTGFQPGVDECVWRLQRALRNGRINPDEWGFGFTLSLMRHVKRRGWKPSDKQLFAMRRLVAELSVQTDDVLIDADDVAENG
jgi:hypothetical protein